MGLSDVHSIAGLSGFDDEDDNAVMVRRGRRDVISCSPLAAGNVLGGGGDRPVGVEKSVASESLLKLSSHLPPRDGNGGGGAQQAKVAAGVAVGTTTRTHHWRGPAAEQSYLEVRKEESGAALGAIVCAARVRSNSNSTTPVGSCTTSRPSPGSASSTSSGVEGNGGYTGLATLGGGGYGRDFSNGGGATAAAAIAAGYGYDYDDKTSRPESLSLASLDMGPAGSVSGGLISLNAIAAAANASAGTINATLRWGIEPLDLGSQTPPPGGLMDHLLGGSFSSSSPIAAEVSLGAQTPPPLVLVEELPSHQVGGGGSRSGWPGERTAAAPRPGAQSISSNGSRKEDDASATTAVAAATSRGLYSPPWGSRGGVEVSPNLAKKSGAKPAGLPQSAASTPKARRGLGSVVWGAGGGGDRDERGGDGAGVVVVTKTPGRLPRRLHQGVNKVRRAVGVG